MLQHCVIFQQQTFLARGCVYWLTISEEIRERFHFWNFQNYYFLIQSGDVVVLKKIRLLEFCVLFPSLLFSLSCLIFSCSFSFCAPLSYGFPWCYLSHLSFVALASIMAEPSCYCWSFDSAHWLMYDIESHPLLGAGEVSGNFRELVTWCHWRSLNMYLSLFCSNCSQFVLFFSLFFVVGFPLFSCLLICCQIWNFYKPYYQVISQFYSVWFRFLVWRSSQYWGRY